MVIDSWGGKTECPRPLGFGMTISFPRVNNHADMDPSGIIPIVIDNIVL